MPKQSTSRASGSNTGKKGRGGASKAAASSSSRKPSAAAGASKAVRRAQSPGAAQSLSMAAMLSAIPSFGGQDDAAELRIRTTMRIARQAPIQAAASTLELLGCIPHTDYREAIRPLLFEAQKSRRQLAGLERQVASLQGDKAAGRIPHFIASALKAPTVQWIKGFAIANPDVSNTYDSALEAARISSLNATITKKIAERDYLKERVDLFITDEMAEEPRKSFIAAAVYSAIEEVFDRLWKAGKKMIVRDATADSHGRPVQSGWEEDISVQESYRALLEDLPIIWGRAISFIDNALLAEEITAHKKQELREASMADVGEAVAGGSLDAKIAALVAKKFQEEKGKGKQVSRSVADDDNHLNANQPLTSSSSPGSSRKRGRESSKSGSHWGEILRWSEAGSGLQGRQQDSRGKRRKLGERAEEQLEGERSSIDVDGVGAVVRTITKVPFMYDNHRTYPDWLLTVSLLQAKQFIWLRMDTRVLESMRFRSVVHLIDCDLPPDIAMHLSAGLKYMMPTKFDTDLISKSWDDFVNRLRWSTLFAYKKDPNALTDDYDPDYAVRRTVTREAPRLDGLFEYGISEGAAAIASMVSKMPKGMDIPRGRTPRSLLPPVSVLKQYLIDHELILLQTDKNLGSAVCSRTWIIEKTFSLLNAPMLNQAGYETGLPLDYQEIPYSRVATIVDGKINKMRQIASRSAGGMSLSPQLPEFFRSMIPQDALSTRGREAFNWDRGTVIPTFYVIPKIHKNPVKARPILPCHSVVQGPAGKFVSKMLKPIIKSAPYIIHGSKDLALKLQKLSLPAAKFDGGTLKHLYFVSGDVVAFYPNIDVRVAHNAACEKFVRWLAETDEDWVTEDNVGDLAWLFRESLEAADSDLVCKFQGKFYRQVRGLAMGVASSPDLANLYGLIFELAAFGKDMHRFPDIAFYGRYIDDILALVYATTEAEALSLIQDNLDFHNCTIEWSSSDQFMTFLDMTLFIDGFTLQHMPFRKQMNHFERIPWISNHPEYVKRGTFMSELSRIATLSSRYDDFVRACREVCDIYIARGYPPSLVSQWLKSSHQKRWDARLSESAPVSLDVLVLKSEYNVSWDLFNVHTLAERMKTAWKVGLRTLSFGRTERLRGGPLPDDVIATKPKYSLAPKLRDGTIGDHHDSFHELGLFGPYLRLDKVGLFNKRFLVGKRRTRQLTDLASMWRRVVLEQRDVQVHTDQQVTLVQSDLERFFPRVVRSRRTSVSPERRHLGAIMESERS